MGFVRRSNCSAFAYPHERGGAIIEFSVVVSFLVFLITGFVDIAIQLRDQGNLFEVSRAVGRDISRITATAPDITTAGVCRRAAVYFYVLGLEPKEYDLVLTPRMINAGENVEALPLIQFDIHRRAPNAFNAMFKNFLNSMLGAAFTWSQDLQYLKTMAAIYFYAMTMIARMLKSFGGQPDAA